MYAVRVPGGAEPAFGGIRAPALAARVAAVVLVDSSVGEGEPGAASGFRAALQADRRAALDSFIRAIFVQPQSENRINELLQGALRLPPDLYAKY